MIRKTIFALAAIATVSATALVSTEASAKGFKGGHWGRFAVGSAIVLGATAVYASCYRYVTLRSGDHPARVLGSSLTGPRAASRHRPGHARRGNDARH